MKYIYTAIVLIISFWSCKGDFEDVPMEFVTVAEGSQYSTTISDTSRQFLLIVNDIHWESIKSNIVIGSVNEPEINFSNHSLLAVIDRIQPNDQYGVNILKVTEKEDEIVVNTEFVEPHDTLVIAPLITRPFKIVKVAKSNKPIAFRK